MPSRARLGERRPPVGALLARGGPCCRAGGARWALGPGHCFTVKHKNLKTACSVHAARRVRSAQRRRPEHGSFDRRARLLSPVVADGLVGVLLPPGLDHDAAAECREVEAKERLRLLLLGVERVELQLLREHLSDLGERGAL